MDLSTALHNLEVASEKRRDARRDLRKAIRAAAQDGYTVKEIADMLKWTPDRVLHF